MGAALPLVHERIGRKQPYVRNLVSAPLGHPVWPGEAVVDLLFDLEEFIHVCGTVGAGRSGVPVVEVDHAAVELADIALLFFFQHE